MSGLSPVAILDVTSLARDVVHNLSDRDVVLCGDDRASFNHFAPLDSAGPLAITFCAKRGKHILGKSNASIIIIEKDLRDEVEPPCGLRAYIYAEDAKGTFAAVIRKYVPTKRSLDTKCNISPMAKIHEGVVLGDRVSIGAGTVVYPNVTVYNDVSIGMNTTIHAGCSIGHPGMSIVRGPDKKPEQFPDIGTVEIGNNVYIGANCCIARSPLGATIIEDDVRIANLTNIGHNACIRKGAVITSACMIARGEIGEDAWLSPGAVVEPGVNVGKMSTVGTGAVAISNVPEETVVVGVPAKPLRTRTEDGY